MLLYDHPWHRGHGLYTTAGLDSGMCLGPSVNFIITMLCLVYFSLRPLPGLHSYKLSIARNMLSAKMTPRSFFLIEGKGSKTSMQFVMHKP